MSGYQTDPHELANAARALDDAVGEVSAGLRELADGASGLGPGGIDAAADAVLREQADLARGVADDLHTAAASARDVSGRYLRMEDDARDDLEKGSTDV